MRPLLLAAVLVALTLASCGSTQSHGRTVTISAAASNKQTNECTSFSSAKFKACTRVIKHQQHETVIVNCGDKITTLGSCTYARAAIGALKVGYATSGAAQGYGVVVNAKIGKFTNPTRCHPDGSTGKTWTDHGAWKCTSTLSKVWASLAP